MSAILGATSLCLLGVLTIFRRTSAKVDENVLWSGYEGVYYSHEGRKAGLLICKSTDKRGQTIYRPACCVTAVGVCYWSPRDLSFCLLVDNKYRKWMAVPLGKGEVVGDIRPCKAGFLINLLNSSGSPTGVIELDSKSYKLSRIENILVARSAEDSSSYIGMQPSRKLVIVNNGSTQSVVGSFPNGCRWDADPHTKYLCYTDKKRVFIIHDGTLVSATVPALTSIQDISMVSQFGQVWVSVNKAFSLGSMIVAFDYDGHYLGTVAYDRFPIHAPFTSVSDPDIRRLTTENLQ